MTTLQARAIYTMVYELPLPQEGYEEARQGINELKKLAKGPFCRETRCKKAGVHRNRRGYLVCTGHFAKEEKSALKAAQCLAEAIGMDKPTIDSTSRLGSKALMGRIVTRARKASVRHG